MSPNECYEPFMEVMMSKIQLSKLVIEFLTDNPDATYEDLLNRLQTAAPLKGQTTSFSEDSLLRHSQWIVDQVILSYFIHISILLLLLRCCYDDASLFVGWLMFNSTFSTNRLYCALSAYCCL